MGSRRHVGKPETKWRAEAVGGAAAVARRVGAAVSAVRAALAAQVLPAFLVLLVE